DLVTGVQTCALPILLEVHDAAELDRALRLRSRLIGINNRNLKTFETTLATSERLAPKIPPGQIVVGESGLHVPADLARLAKLGKIGRASCRARGEEP